MLKTNLGYRRNGIYRRCRCTLVEKSTVLRNNKHHENRRTNKHHESSLEKTSIMKTIHMNNATVKEPIKLFHFIAIEEKTTTIIQITEP